MAWKEIAHHPKKFILIELLIIVMMFMVVFLTGLTNGLGRAVSSQIENYGKVTYLLSSDSGQLHIAGQELTQLKQSEWTKKRRELIGFIFQNHQLLPYLTISEQLQLVANLSSDQTKEESRQEMVELLDQLGILESKNKYPSQLSGGQKQRVAIARAFISHPQLILADEPTASLDEDRGREIAALIQKEVKEQNKAAVMVTHDQRILEFVDTVYELKHGKLYKIFL
ncbi:ABC transporter ATP-binding protein [Streptococcus dysgalactiae]|uniref:ABC transporter ATP-binding protein n=1 Tax=Streptococcus dysgalactiae TaxID=1334 RepID=UPI003857D8F5